MMVRVKGEEHPWWEGMTIADLLKELNDPYPYVAARINGTVISRPDFERTTIPDGAEVFLIPMIAGG